MNLRYAGVFALVFVGTTGCGLSPDQFSQVKITTAIGRTLYVNRLARGVSYDTLWISASSGTCRAPSENDIALHDHAGYPLYYSLPADGSLVLFVQVPGNIPKNFPIVVRQEEVHPLDWNKIKKRYASGEIRRVLVEITNSSGCLATW
jgi:hypothetical protein